MKEQNLPETAAVNLPGRWSIPRLFATSRYFIIVAVICMFVVATLLLLSGALIAFHSIVFFIRELPWDPEDVRGLLLTSVEDADVFLVAMVMYVISVGFYTLFVDQTLPVPDWLAINDLDDLKNRLVGGVSAALGVLFLGQAIAWDGSRNLLTFGVGTAAVIVALTYFTTHHHSN